MKTSNKLLLIIIAVMIGGIIGVGLFCRMTMPENSGETSHLLSRFHKETAQNVGHAKTLIQAGNVVNAVSIEGPFHIILKPGTSNQVLVKTDDDLFEQLVIKNENHQLQIHPKPNVLLQSETPIRVEIVSDTVKTFALSGAIQLDAQALQQNSLKLEVAGQSKINLSGKIDMFSVRLSGASNFNAKKLIAKNVSLLGSGSVKAEVYAEENLSITASGNTEVTYYGHPKNVQKEVTGASKVKVGG